MQLQYILSCIAFKAFIRLQMSSESADRLKKLQKKYKDKFELTKVDFIQFVKKKVQLSETKSKKFLDMIKQQVSEQFSQQQLIKLFHYIAAYQAGQSIKDLEKLDEQKLEAYTKIRFKESENKKKQKQKAKHSDKLKQKEEQQEKINVVSKNQKQTKIQRSQKYLKSQKNSQKSNLSQAQQHENEQQQKQKQKQRYDKGGSRKEKQAQQIQQFNQKELNQNNQSNQRVELKNEIKLNIQEIDNDDDYGATQVRIEQDNAQQQVEIQAQGDYRKHEHERAHADFQSKQLQHQTNQNFQQDADHYNKPTCNIKTQGQFLKCKEHQQQNLQQNKQTSFSKKYNNQVEQIDDEQQVQNYIQKNHNSQLQQKQESIKQQLERAQRKTRQLQRLLQQQRQQRRIQKEKKQQEQKQRLKRQQQQRIKKIQLQKKQAKRREAERIQAEKKQNQKRQIQKRKQQAIKQRQRKQKQKQQRQRQRQRQQRQKLKRQRQQKQRQQRQQNLQRQRIQKQKIEHQKFLQKIQRQQKQKQKNAKQQMKKQQQLDRQKQKKKEKQQYKSSKQLKQQNQGKQLKTKQSQNSNKAENKKKLTDTKQNELEVLSDNSKSQIISIKKFEKTGQDFMNPVIKYQIQYMNKKQKYFTFRRYSQIQKLLSYLRYKYQGVVLPEMPPKEGIKGSLFNFWKSSVNQQFLHDRKQKLKQLLNRIMACQFVNKDEELHKFLTDENFQVPTISQQVQGSYLQSIIGLKDIVFNYNELKDYGMAYYNYIKQYSKEQIDTQCSRQFNQLKPIMTSIMALNEYRLVMNKNFQKRRQIMHECKLKGKQLKLTKFDKILEEAQRDCNQLNMQYGRYLQLKSTQGWENYLLKQKEGQGGQSKQKTQINHNKTKERIKNTQQNLMKSIDRFCKKNSTITQKISQQLLQWRKKAHP